MNDNTNLMTKRFPHNIAVPTSAWYRALFARVTRRRPRGGALIHRLRGARQRDQLGELYGMAVQTGCLVDLRVCPMLLATEPGVSASNVNADTGGAL